MENGNALWTLLTFLGPVLLGAALLWAFLRNRKERNSPREMERTERETAKLYDDLSRDDDAHETERADPTKF